MPYTEAVLLEIQRMATVVPMFSRASTQDQYVGEYFIKKVRFPLYCQILGNFHFIPFQGTMGVVSLYSSNYSEKTWGDPLVFRPERFLDEKNNVINAQKIMAFGLGMKISGYQHNRNLEASILI